MPSTSQPERDPDGLRWHQALAYALIGRIEPALGSQDRPDLDVLLVDLAARYPDAESGLASEIARARIAGGLGWPRVVPDELAVGLGPAQFVAALTELRRRLGLDGGPRRTLSSREPDAAERVLLRDVPPHHGS